MPDSLFATVRGALYPYDDPRLTPLVQRLRESFGRGLLAVVFYGSKLSPATDTLTSIFDFFLICEDYDRFHRDRRFHALFNRFLPPNVYYVDLGNGLACKACTISLEHLRREVRGTARDFYHRGRFSKRFGVVWARDDGVVDALAQAWLDATRSLIEPALILCGNRFELPDFTRALLRLSYLGEVRPETDDKIERLYRAEGAFYGRVHGELLERHRREHSSALGSELEDGRTVYFQRSTINARLAERKRLERALKRSKRRAVTRWPKQMLQVDNWLDIILAKLERTQGVKIELTPLQRRHPLIFGWPTFFRLKRQGKFK